MASGALLKRDSSGIIEWTAQIKADLDILILRPNAECCSLIVEKKNDVRQSLF